MRTRNVNQKNPTEVIKKFLTELPSTIRKEICTQLFPFFEGDWMLVRNEPFDDILNFMVAPSGEFENFYRAILIISALDFIFTTQNSVVHIFNVRGEIQDILAMRPGDPPRVDMAARIRDYEKAESKQSGSCTQTAGSYLPHVHFHASS